MRPYSVLLATVVVLAVVIIAVVAAKAAPARRRAVAFAAGTVAIAIVAGVATVAAARPRAVTGGKKTRDEPRSTSLSPSTPRSSPQPPGVTFHGETLTDGEVAAIRKIPRQKIPAEELPVTTGDVGGELPYRPEPYRLRTTLHIGQRKLLMSEVDFLTDYARSGDTIVYAGSAPGIHMPFLASLFRAYGLRFELYDPRRFVLRGAGRDRITPHQEYFTDDTARKYRGRDDVLFISDIRSKVAGETGEKNEDRISEDMAMQRRWVTTMNPRAAMLKYRPRYASTGEFEYLDGSVRLQAWAPQASTECRLVAERPYPTKTRSAHEHESTMYYFNTVVRQWASFDHGIPLALVPGLDYCYDCALEARIWTRYLTNVRKLSEPTPDAIAALFNLATGAIHRPLDHPPHGLHPELPAAGRRDKLAGEVA